MTLKRTLGFALLMMAALVLVPASQAQVQDLNLQDVISRLAPASGGNELIFDILRYLIFFVGFITMMLVPDKQLTPSLLMVAVIGMAILSKLNVFRPDDLASLGLNCGMFVIPLIVAGLLRGRGKTPRALLPAILTGMLGGGYFFLYWALVQR